jgi:glycosyltransferase involved in cell wall biosynthesis
MKVLITTESYYPDVCGVSLVVQNIAERLAQKGHDVTVATGSGHDHGAERYNNVRIEHFNVWGNGATSCFGDVQQYTDFVLDFKGDVIVNECLQTWNSDLIIPRLAEIQAAKVLHVHGLSWHHLKARRPLMRWRQSRYLRNVPKILKLYDCLVHLTENMSDRTIAKQMSIAHSYVIGNGADDIFFDDSHETDILQTYKIDKKFLLCVGNYSSGKNQEFVLNSFYRADSSKKTALVFTGNGPSEYLKRLKHLKRKLDKKFRNRGVRFLTGVPRNDIAQFYKLARLFLYGSKCEAFPLVIAESMSSRTPFVSTDVGNIKTLPGGIVVRSEREMSELIDRLLRDRLLLKSLASEGRNYAEAHFRWEKIVDAFEAMLYEAIRINEARRD